MPLELGFGEIGDEVVFELAGRFEIACTAMGALLRMDVVFDEVGAGWRFGAESSRDACDAPCGGGRPGTLGVVAAGAWAFAALADRLEFVLQLRQPTPQFGVLRFQLGDPFS